MKNALLNFNKNSLLTLERALNSYLDNELSKTSADYCYTMNTQPNLLCAIIRETEHYKAHFEEIKRVNLLQKQIAYQKRLLKI